MARDITKLPKWAQQEIERLRRDVESWKATASAGPEDSDTFANPYSDAPTPLGRGTSIQFKPEDTAWRGGGFRVNLESDGVLVVNGSDSLQVQPWASNAIRVRIGSPL